MLRVTAGSVALGVTPAKAQTILLSPFPAPTTTTGNSAGDTSAGNENATVANASATTAWMPTVQRVRVWWSRGEDREFEMSALI